MCSAERGPLRWMWSWLETLLNCPPKQLGPGETSLLYWLCSWVCSLFCPPSETDCVRMCREVKEPEQCFGGKCNCFPFILSVSRAITAIGILCVGSCYWSPDWTPDLQVAAYFDANLLMWHFTSTFACTSAYKKQWQCNRFGWIERNTLHCYYYYSKTILTPLCF